MSLMPTRRAVIDVGTNSVKLLTADVAGPEVVPVEECSRQTRLGQGFFATHRLQPGAIEMTAKAVAEFVDRAKQRGATCIRVIATSAARDALNSDQLCSAIEQTSGLKLEIISGAQEAQWAFRGATTDPALASQPLLLLDVGGGSTEFILGHGKQKDFSESFRLGTIRLLEKLSPGDPPAPEELAYCRQCLNDFLQEQIRPRLEPAMRRETKFHPVHGGLHLVGTGGTASILGCMEAKLESFDRDRLEATRLSFSRVRWHVEHLWSLRLAERRNITGLPKNRADVILTGVAIFEAVMEQFGFTELRLSTRGLRFAAVRMTNEG